jgi:hypothetical protein
VPRQRTIAVIIMLIPAIAGIYGVKLMRDAVFTAFEPGGFSWWMMLSGFFLFVLAVVFIGGFVRYRDKKRNYRPKFNDDLSEED